MKHIVVHFVLAIIVVFPFCDCQQLTNIKQRPAFNYDTILAANRVLISRNASLTTVILNVQASTYQGAQPIVYSILENTQFFRIDPYNGYVQLYSPFTDSTRSSYQFTVVATDSATGTDQQSSFLNVNVEIVDVNNNAPVFLTINPYFVSVSELVEANSIIYNQLYVYDTDWGQSSTKQIRIYCDSTSSDNTDAEISCAQFSVECSLVTDNNYRCNIRLLRPLSFYSKPSYVMSISATNNAIGRTSTINFVINVVNSKATYPYFSQSSYVVYMDYNTNQGTNVLQVDVNNEVNSLADKRFIVKDSGNYFAVNASTFTCTQSTCSQSIQLLKKFAYPTGYAFDITYISYVGTITATVYVVVQQPKTARSAPVFTKPTYEFAVPENIPAGSVIRGTNIVVMESDQLSFYSSGFNLVLLNSDLVSESDTFELGHIFAKRNTNVVLKLRPLATLDFEYGPLRYDLVLKATSGEFSSFANITIQVANTYDDCLPKFQSSDSIVLDNPENLKVNDIIATVNVAQCVRSDQPILKYSIIGLYRDRFWIDALGRIYLTQPLVTNYDDGFFYNLTLYVGNDDGYSDYTSFVIFINTTSNAIFQQTAFSFSIEGPKSELNLNDSQSLLPPLIISANSKYSLKYSILEMSPGVANIKINEDTGEIYLTSALPQSIVSSFDRISITVQIVQYQTFGAYTTFLGSLQCAATIFFKTSAVTIASKPPYFLRNYYTVVDRENVYQNVPLVTVKAISTNGNSGQVISYYIVNDSTLFTIDRLQGSIYPLKNLSLAINTYNIKVLAVDSADNSQTTTEVSIQIVARAENTITCNTNYLLINVPQKSVSDMNPAFTILGSLSCLSSSMFSDPDFQFSIGRPLGVYDCKGFKVNYLPYIGIASKNGSVISFESLSRDVFCDAFYIINVFKDQTAVSIPFHLILITESSYGSPIFLRNSPSTVFIPNYAHSGSFITNIGAYDANQKKLVNSYTIAKTQASNYFNMDQQGGFISLKQAFDSNNLPPSTSLPLTVIAAAPNGLTSSLTITIDFSELINNYLNLQFDSNLNNTISLSGNTVYTSPIYTASTVCSNPLTNNNAQSSSPCGAVGYTLNFYRNSNFSNFAIDRQQNVYLTSPLVYDFQIQTKYVFILNAFSNSNSLNRLNQNEFKDVSVVVESNGLFAPSFEYSSYSVSILDTTPVGTVILTFRYIANANDDVTFRIEQISNIQINNFFEVQQFKQFQTISLIVKSSPIINDKPDLSFLISARSSKAQYANVVSTTTVTINLLTSLTLSNYPKFQQPSLPNEQLFLNVNNLVDNQVIYQLKTTNTNTESVIVYRIVNVDKAGAFYIDRSNIRISLILLTSLSRSNFLLFIEARDTSQPSSIAYTTLNIIIINNTVTDTRPYFDPYLTNGNLYLNLYDNYPTNTPFLDLLSFITGNNQTIYAYVFNAVSPYTRSDRFTVGSNKQVVLTQPLDYNNANQYSLFVYVTNTPYNQATLNPSFTNIPNILYLFIQIISSNKYAPRFVDYTRFIFVEPSSAVKTAIGYARAVDDDQIQPNNVVKYDFLMCTYRSYKNQENTDRNLCDLFSITSDGTIYTNNQGAYDIYKDGYFILTIYAVDSGFPALNTTIHVMVFFAVETEKARFIITIPTDKYFVDYLENLKLAINQAVNIVYDYQLLDYYYSDVDYTIPVISDSILQIEVCFYILKAKSYQFLSYDDTYDLLTHSDKMKTVFQYYSISKLERCSSRDSFNHPYKNWKFSSLSVGVMILTVFLLFFTILAVVILVQCWISHMKHSIITKNLEMCDSTSSNYLID